jgi:uroporphyrinogen-III synthase
MASKRPLAGVRVAITRPVGTGRALARRVRLAGGVPFLLPGSRLAAADAPAAARAALETALASDLVIFTSPAAVSFARRLAPLRTRAGVLAPGVGTRQALRNAGCRNVVVPTREDSEGLLALPEVQEVRGKRVGIIGAAGGRGMLEHAIASRGAQVMHAHVYRRMPPRLDRRHAWALRRESRKPLYVLVSSAEALANILAGLPDDARLRLLAGHAVASSERLAEIAQQAGFARVLRAGSAHAAQMLAEIAADRAGFGQGRSRADAECQADSGRPPIIARTPP